MQEYLSHARVSMSNLMQGVLSSGARGSIHDSPKWSCLMQGVLSSHARVSVIKVAEYMTQQWLVIRPSVETMQEVPCKGFCLHSSSRCWFRAAHARGSTHLTQGYLPSHARGSVVQQRMFHARGSVMQEVLSPKRFCLMQEVLSSELDPMQGVLCPIPCKSICHARGSVSCKSICHARGSVMQEVLCPK